MELADGSALGGSSILESVSRREIREAYTQFPGKRREVVSHCEETVVRLRDGERTWHLVLRAYNDGVAWRYEIPHQSGWEQLELVNERTRFQLPPDTHCYSLALNGFTTSYEKLYEYRRAADLPPDSLLALPFVFQTPGRLWGAITEAHLVDYAGLYLTPATHGALKARLAPRAKEPTMSVRAKLPMASPWRLVLVATDPAGLIESDVVLHLNPPCAIADTSWIRPGKTTFPWWNGYYEESTPFAMGLNTETMKYYIDFCAAAGIPYHSLDGRGDTAWYGGPIVPYQGADPTRAIDGLNLPEVIDYARAKHVGLRLWLHWEAAAAHMERAFPLYRQWGIEGIMLDFFDRDDQEMIDFIHRAVQRAAENRLTITLHGCPKPTGLERTYPNLLTSEAVMNLEYNKWDQVPPTHETLVPMTRMLAGPLDFHQGSLRTVRPADFFSQNERPLVIGTPTRTLASYVVFQNHLPMVADYPSAYRRHPALPLLAAIPVSWDDTRAVKVDPAKLVVIARRHGTTWWVGAMNDQHPYEIDLPLNFLDPGEYRVTVCRDVPTAADALTIEYHTLTAADKLHARLDGAGGLFLRAER